MKQSLAITGSMDQRGRVQAVGGLNEKVEGFFDVCCLEGLNGDQGVIIPASNAQHLMLRQDLVGAVKEGRFHIYAVTTIDEALQLLTGTDAGLRDENGHYEECSINGRVEARLTQLATHLREQALPTRELV
jgi:predicted ATP-dependent protease